MIILLNPTLPIDENIINKPNFLSVESRVYPTKNKPILKLIHQFEDLVEAIPLVRNYLCYNISIIKKD